MLKKINWIEFFANATCIISLVNTLHLSWNGYFDDHHFLAVWCVIFNILNVLIITSPVAVYKINCKLRLLRHFYHLIFKSE